MLSLQLEGREGRCQIENKPTKTGMPMTHACYQTFAFPNNESKTGTTGSVAHIFSVPHFRQGVQSVSDGGGPPLTFQMMILPLINHELSSVRQIPTSFSAPFSAALLHGMHVGQEIQSILVP